MIDEETPAMGSLEGEILEWITWFCCPTNNKILIPFVLSYFFLADCGLPLNKTNSKVPLEIIIFVIYLTDTVYITQIILIKA